MKGLGATGGAGLAYGAMSTLGLAPSTAAPARTFEPLAAGDLGGSPRDVDTNSYAAVASVADRCSYSIGQI